MCFPCIVFHSKKVQNCLRYAPWRQGSQLKSSHFPRPLHVNIYTPNTHLLCTLNKRITDQVLNLRNIPLTLLWHITIPVFAVMVKACRHEQKFQVPWKYHLVCYKVFLASSIERPTCTANPWKSLMTCHQVTEDIWPKGKKSRISWNKNEQWNVVWYQGRKSINYEYSTLPVLNLILFFKVQINK